MKATPRERNIMRHPHAPPTGPNTGLDNSINVSTSCNTIQKRPAPVTEWQRKTSDLEALSDSHQTIQGTVKRKIDICETTSSSKAIRKTSLLFLC
jgi:hypothetical protein